MSRRAYRCAQWFRAQYPAMGLSEAMRYARALERGEKYELYAEIDNEEQAWDGDCPAPKCLFSMVVKSARLPADSRERRHVLASLGMIGVDSDADPYLSICKAELFEEAIDYLDSLDAEEARALSQRATFAGPS